MCFSATASFVTVGTTTLVGIACLSKVRQWRELPLASLPLIFAGQQTVEGCLWLTLPVDPDGAVSSLLTLLFLLYAKVFWPVFAPFTALLIEPDRRRRQLMAIAAAAGAVVAAYLLWSIYVYPHGASIRGGHIIYMGEAPSSIVIGALYLVATAAAPLLSSHRAVILLGAIVFAGSLLAYLMYWEAFASVWCFFAAAGSVVILVHFERVRQMDSSAAAQA
jgi:uncharacterized protein DUF6629